MSSKNTRKRKRSLTDKNKIVSKRLRKNLNIKSENLGFLSDLQDETRQNKLYKDYHTQHHRHFYNHLIKVMYQLDLSILCSLRKFTYEYKYPSLSLTFEGSEIETFNNIVIHHENKSIHIRIEYVDKYYTENSIGYSKLFSKPSKHYSLLNSYFNIFTKSVLKTNNLLTDVEYLIIYTNSKFNLTKEKTFIIGKSKNYYPFKFDNIQIKGCDILKDILFTNNNIQENDFYQFSQDVTTREKLLKHLEFSSSMKKVVQERKLSQKLEESIKKAFFNKLVFAVNQPNREKLSSIVKVEMKKKVEGLELYKALQERILCDLKTSYKNKNCVFDVSEIIYQFNLLMNLLHDMFVHKNVFSVNFGKNDNSITIYHQNKISYLYVHNADTNINSNLLFFFGKKENMFCINKYFTLFVEEFSEDIEHLVFYTNANLDLTTDKKFKGKPSNDPYSLKFNSVNIWEEKYRILRYSSSINENDLYQFSEKITREKIINMLVLPPSLQKEKEEGRLSNENEREKKEKFLDKLIFAVNQPDEKKLNTLIRNKISKLNNDPYSYEELHEITLRWIESHEFDPLTQKIMEKFLEEIKSNKSSYQITPSKHNNEIKFARTVVGACGAISEVNKFLDFLITGRGQKYLTVLKKKLTNLSNMSNILNGSGAKSSNTFKELYVLWFDEEGNETQYLKSLEKQGINLTNVTSFLTGSSTKAPQTFKDLYDLWIDEEGNKTKYLKSLEKEEINLTNLSSILQGSGAKAPKVFKDLYDLWFDDEGHKTKYLKSLEEEGINLCNVSSLISGSGSKAPKAFTDLYDLWFDEDGHKTRYLRSLENEGINLASVSSILSGVRANAATAFKDLYNLWFDEEGYKTQYLKSLEEAGINLANVSSILSTSRGNAATAFKDLHDLWFDEKGCKTKYLKSLEEEGINLANVSSILSGLGSKASKTFKDLYDLWFDKNGQSTKYLKSLKEEGINLVRVSSILSGTGANAAIAFKDLYNLWFDEKGIKTKYLKSLQKEGINLSNVTSILCGSAANGPKVFKDLYDLWFDEEGHKTKYLKTLEQEGINLTNVSSILNGSGFNASKAFKDLYDLWFDKEGLKTKYLISLQTEEINLANVSNILCGSGTKAPKAFKDLYDLWFDEKGCKTKYLKSLKEEGINLAHVTSILSGAGPNAFKAFKDLYDLWFDKEGLKTKYLKSLEKEGINLTNVSGILSTAGANAATAFKDLYDLWFNEKEYKTKYLKSLEKEGINLANVSSILNGSGAKGPKAFKDLYDLWFNRGRKTKYLKSLEKEKISFTNVSCILSGSGSNAPKAFKDLYDLWFDKEGNVTPYLTFGGLNGSI
ncbi:uncharacterized protein LOC105205897 [Solenopsis invicta]|uniref:uncharacterized protein LOC105205897 n=1 Tax=Solenopsis invicta TaxID=13686 RepID=UPI00193DC6FE|nr:uncharacterized protein LOC105205897 [Solenopsis invicta]XP_039310709.1 uncharacterized protein LOC105205897 [Solenopsis invicta]